MITQDQLTFKPLAGVTWINNAVIPIKPHFRLSISKNIYKGKWYVGSDDCYEVGVQDLRMKVDRGNWSGSGETPLSAIVTWRRSMKSPPKPPR